MISMKESTGDGRGITYSFTENDNFIIFNFLDRKRGAL